MVTAIAAKKVVNRGEYQVGIDDAQAGAAERVDVDQVQAGRHEQAAYVFRKLDHLDAGRRYLGGTAQHVEHADAYRTDEAIIDHIQGRHTAADDAILAAQVIRFGLTCIHDFG